MARSLFFATDNNYKKVRFQAYFKPLGLSVLTYSDFNKKVKVFENGKNAEQNALKKAKAGFKLTGLPSIGVDYWFQIKGLPKRLQPGPFVRRIFVGKSGRRGEATDEQMINYYQKIIEGLGGKAKGFWTSSMALVISPKKIYTSTFTRETVLVSKRSSKLTRGEPLNSLQIDTETGKYFTDLTQKEWIMLQESSEKRYIDFMKKHLREFPQKEV